MEDNQTYPIIKKIGSDYIIRVKGSEGEKLNKDMVKNATDALYSYLKDSDKIDILKVIHDLEPAYFNEMLEVLGIAKSTLSRDIENLLEEGVIQRVGFDDEDVQLKQQNLKQSRGPGLSKFFKINHDRLILEGVSGKRISIVEFIRDDQVSNQLLDKIRKRKEYNEKMAKENVIKNLPDHVKITKHILEKVLMDKTELRFDIKKFRAICYFALDHKWPNKNLIDLTLEHLKNEDILIEKEGKIFLVKPKNKIKSKDVEAVLKALISSKK